MALTTQRAGKDKWIKIFRNAKMYVNEANGMAKLLNYYKATLKDAERAMLILKMLPSTLKSR